MKCKQQRFTNIPFLYGIRANPTMPNISHNPTTLNIPHPSTTPNIPQIQQPIIVTHLSNFAQSITKLNKENYMTWCGLVEPFLKGHDLHGFTN
jgi:hypothetical protein